MNTTVALTKHALNTEYEGLPPDAVRAAKVFILDTIGVGVAGVAAAFANDVFEAARSWGGASGKGGAHVFARGEKLPAPTAAFVNGFQIHCQEFDCVHEPAVVHPMATIFAALMAEADDRNTVHGRDFIAAVALAVDVAATLGVSATSGIKFFRPANAGIFGATLGVARIRGFDEETALNALGYALAFCSGTMQAHVEGKPALPIQIGNAARGAIAACDLAAMGVPGPHDVFDGPFGYFSLFEDETDPAPAVADLGKIWRITEVSHKPFPTGRAAQGGIVAVQRLRRDGVSFDNLESLTLSAPPLINRLVGRPYKEQMAVNYARLCFPYLGAVTLQKGVVGLEDFGSQMLDDAAVGAIARRIDVVDNGESDPAVFTPQTATARLKDGREIEARIDRLYGSPADPLSHEAHLDKFRNCMAFGLPKDGTARAEALIEYVDNLEQETNVATLAKIAAGL